MAKRHRKVYQHVWDDEKFIRLDPPGKLIALYVLTGQSNRCGIFAFSVGQAVEQTGIPAEPSPNVSGGFRDGLRRVCDTLGWRWDEAARVVYIPSWWKHNPPENPNVLKGSLDDIEVLPQTPLLADFLANTRYLSPSLAETFRERSGMVRETLPEPCPNQEQEQEQEQEPTVPPSGGGKGDKGKKRKPAREKKPRPRNELFDAIAEVTGSDASIGSVAGHVGTAAAELAKAAVPYTPAEVREFARRYHELCDYPSARERTHPTVGEVVKNISRIRIASAAVTTTTPTPAVNHALERTKVAEPAPPMRFGPVPADRGVSA